MLLRRAYPEYYDAIETPMDLSTVKKSLAGYQSLAAALSDIRLIWRNCLQFNQEGSEIAASAISLGLDTEALIEVRVQTYSPSVSFCLSLLSLFIYIFSFCLFNS
jgi:hypothetical protein